MSRSYSFCSFSSISGDLPFLVADTFPFCIFLCCLVHYYWSFPRESVKYLLSGGSDGISNRLEYLEFRQIFSQPEPGSISQRITYALS